MKRIFTIAMSAALLLGFGSCSKELDNTAGDDNGAAAVQFSIKTQKGNLVTYADIASAPEWAVNTTSIYIFDATTNLLIGNNSDFDYNTTTKIFTAKTAWLDTNKGKTVNVYFVGNDDQANLFGGTTHVGTVTKGATTRSTFENKGTVAQTVDVSGKAELLTSPLLFSASALGVQVPNMGKIDVPVTLKRREARFDIVNTDMTNFTVTKVMVSKAKIQGFIFARSQGAPITSEASLKEITTFPAYDVTDATLMPSVFYMYPTQLGTGNTEIIIVGEYNSVEQEFKVNSTAQIEANKRYKLVFNAPALSFDLVTADYDDGDDLDMDPLSGVLSFINGTGGNGLWAGSFYQLATNNSTSQTLTVTLNVPTKAGATASAAKASGTTIMTDGDADITPGAVALTYAVGYQQTFDIVIDYSIAVVGTKTVVTFTDANNPANTLNVTLARLNYTVGDLYPDPDVVFSSPGVVEIGTMPIGMVCWVDSSDKSTGKIISLDESGAMIWGPRGVDTGATSTTDGLVNMAAVKVLDDTFSAYPAFAWVHAKNPTGTVYTPGAKGIWYLPVVSELVDLKCNNRAIDNATSPGDGGYRFSVLNARLYDAGATQFYTNVYWTSRESSNNNAYNTYIAYPESLGVSKETLNGTTGYPRVRACAAF